jgi:hypothetical protein
MRGRLSCGNHFEYYGVPGLTGGYGAPEGPEVRGAQNNIFLFPKNPKKKFNPLK